MKAIRRTRRGRVPGRTGRARRADRQDQIHQEAREKARRNSKLREHEPDVRRGDGGAQHLDWLVGIPWKKRSKVKEGPPAGADIWMMPRPREGQERIAEYLAVQQRACGKVKGPILCAAVGPPGVSRDLAGQVRRRGDRPQLRSHVAGRRSRRGGGSWHRRTTIGSLRADPPGGMKKAKTSGLVPAG